MRKKYTPMDCTMHAVETETGFLAASKEDAINADTEVTIERQVGGETIEFSTWE